MKYFYTDTNYQRLLKIIFPETSPRTVQNGKTLVVYDLKGFAVGCFLSIEECATFFKIDKNYLKKIICEKKLMYGLYKPIWVKTGKGNGWHYNKGETI